MKKLILVFCLICFALPCFAINQQKDNEDFLNSLNINTRLSANSLQEEYENKFSEQLRKDLSIGVLLDSIYLLKDDYKGYMNNGGSIYGTILYNIDKIEKSNNPYKNCDLKYLNQVKSNIENAVKNNVVPQLIVVGNEEYKLLSDNTKDLVNLNNILSETNKEVYLNNIIKDFAYKIGVWEEECEKYKFNMKKLKEIEEEIDKEENICKNYLNSYKDFQNKSEVVYNKVKEIQSSLSSLSYQIYEVGKAYEQKKFLEWAQRNNKKVTCGNLSNFVYAPYASAPQLGCIYTYLPKRDFTLQTLQSVNGGVILTGSYSLTHATHINNIFLQTSKVFADGQYIMEPLVVEYKGFYDYYTVLGVKKRIYKFYRLGQPEIDKNFNIPGQPFYFYQAY